jgi:hypothetical protein
MASTFPGHGGRPADRPSNAGKPRDPWAPLEQLLQRLTDAGGTSQAVAAAVEAARDAIGADVAYWYSRAGGKVASVVGVRAFSPGPAAALAGELLARLDPGHDAVLWTNPAGRPAEGVPDAALLVAGPRTQGCLVAVSFDPARRFDDGDAKAVRMAMKMLLAQRTQQAAGTKQLLHGLLQCLTTVIDAKDPYTAGHSERVARIGVLLARQLGLPAASEGDVYLAGLLHDVGKIGVRDDLLQKPGKLTPEEMTEVRQHALVGDRIVASIRPFERLRPAVRNHHERWDGTGYPDRLAGEAIPVLARVLGVADACDAMMSPRRYRAARTPLEIDRIFTAEAGRQFDPATVRAFMAVRHEIYPPIYQKGIGDSAYHAIEGIVDGLSDGSALRLPAAPDATKSGSQ